MVNREMFISAVFLSILASVAAFSFLITQLIFMCFGRSRKKKRAKQKTPIKIAGKDHDGEATGVKMCRVDGGTAKVNDGNLGVNCDNARINGDRSIRIGGDSFGVDSGEVDCERQIKKCDVSGEEFVGTDTLYDGGDENASGYDGGGDDDDSGGDGNEGVGDVDGKIDSIKRSGNNGNDDAGYDDGGGGDDGVSDSIGEIDSKRNGNGGLVRANNIGGDDGAENSGKSNGSARDNHDDIGVDGSKYDTKIGGDGGLKDDKNIADGVGNINICVDGDIGNNNGTGECDSENYGSCDGGISVGIDDDDFDGSHDTNGNNNGGVEGKDNACVHSYTGDFNSGAANVEDRHNNIDRNQSTVVGDSSETRDRGDANNIHKYCNFKYNNTGTEDHTNNCCEVSKNTCSKTLSCSCKECVCQYNQASTNGSDGQSAYRQHGAVHVPKQHIHFRLDVDIAKYQIDDGSERYPQTSRSRNFAEHFSDGEVIDNCHVQNGSLTQTRNTVSSFWENAPCNNVPTEETTTKYKSRSWRINVQQNTIKDSVKFETMKVSDTNDDEYLIKNTTDCSTNDCGLILDDNFNEYEPFFCKEIAACKHKTRDVAIQVFEEDNTSGRNSPTVFEGSTRNSSTISCCCSSEYEYGREMDSDSSSENFDEDNCTRKSNSSIVARILSKVVECCVSALYGSAQN